MRLIVQVAGVCFVVGIFILNTVNEIKVIHETPLYKVQDVYHVMPIPPNTTYQRQICADNGLKYLDQYSDEAVRKMLLDPAWTKATMVREPRSRTLSSYFHMLFVHYFEIYHRRKPPSFPEFVTHIEVIDYDHWTSQVLFPPWFYKYMLVGRFENMREFGEVLLRRIGAWDEWGHKWGEFRNETVFSSIYHKSATSQANTKLKQYYTRELEDRIIRMFKEDYRLFNFSTAYISDH